MKSVLSGVLVVALAFHTACAGSLGPPERVRPENELQRGRIIHAAMVVVTTVDGRRRTLRSAVVDPPYLRGVRTIHNSQKAEAIPLDSVAAVRIPRSDSSLSSGQQWLVMSAVVVGAVAIMVLLACATGGCAPDFGDWGPILLHP